MKYICNVCQMMHHKEDSAMMHLKPYAEIESHQLKQSNLCLKIVTTTAYILLLLNVIY